MSRIIFLQLNHYELHGPESIAAVIASHGHKSRLVVPGLEADPMGAVARFRPDVVGIGHTTVEREEALAWAGAIKRRTGAKVVLGGIDPTFHPELALDPAVDAVFCGEAEYTMLEFLDRVDEGEDFCDLAGLMVKNNGEAITNPVRPLIAELDSLPFPDKDLYLGRYPYFGNYPIKFFMASRGCPHHCTYCVNQGLKGLYPDPEHYVRFKSPDYLIAEIKTTLMKYPARTIGFNDDLFTNKISWLMEFLPRYKKEIARPFFCCARIDTMTEDKAALLSDAGCYTCWYGLESASPDTRESILGRKITNGAISRGTEILHQHGILTQSYNMMNIPGESFEKGLYTLRFNIELKNDFVVASLFQPFPGTQITNKLIAEGKLDETKKLASRESLSYFAFSAFEQKDTKKFENLQKLFIIGKWFPRSVPFIKRLTCLPPNPIFDILFLVSFAIDYGRSHRLRAWEVGYYNLRHLWTTYFAKSRLVPGK